MVTKGYGWTVDMIDWACPADLQPYADAHVLEIKESDQIAYTIWGNYGLSALIVAIEHNLAGKKAKSEYTKKLTFEDLGLTEEEKKQKALEAFVKKMNAMKKAFDSRKGGQI